MKNFQNRREYEKLINTKKLRVFNSFPLVYNLLNSGKWFGSYGKKHHVKNRVKFKTELPQKFNYYSDEKLLKPLRV